MVENIKLMGIDQIIPGESVKIKQVGPNEIFIVLEPPENFTMNLVTPLFDAEIVAPVEISLVALSSSLFLLNVIFVGGDFVTAVSSLVLEVVDSNGNVVLRIVAPPLVG